MAVLTLCAVCSPQITWRVERADGSAQGASGTGGWRLESESVRTWVVGRAVAAPPAVPRGAAGAAPSSTTVAVALPLPGRRTRFGGEGGGVDMEAAAEEEPGGGAGSGGCHVYATLPLRPSGLPFDLQVRVRARCECWSGARGEAVVGRLQAAGKQLLVATLAGCAGGWLRGFLRLRVPPSELRAELLHLLLEVLVRSVCRPTGWCRRAGRTSPQRRRGTRCCAGW